MKPIRTLIMVVMLSVLAFPYSLRAEEPMPEYIQKAQMQVEKASAYATDWNKFADEVLIARNFIRNAEAEYKKNLSWTGKLDPKAEPTVRYYAGMAQLQAGVVLAQVGKISKEKELAHLEKQASGIKARIKVFDDKNTTIASLKDELARRDATIKDLTAKSMQLNTRVAALTADVTAKNAALGAYETKGSDVSRELAAKMQLVAQLEQKAAEQKKELDTFQSDNTRLKAELAALAAQKDASESQSKEKIKALARAQQFVAEVGNLGGAIKPGSDNMVVMFSRSTLLSAPKNDRLTKEGDQALIKISNLLKKYPEYRAKIKVHGFGTAKNEDASASDRMARLIREALLAKGIGDPGAVEALGIGQAEPIYPKNNPEGNRRVEIAFVKK